MIPGRSDYTIYEGPTYTVEWYYDEKGRMPAYEYFEEMDEGTQVRLLQMIKHIADSPIGTKLPITMLNIEDQNEKIYAFKPQDQRFFNFMAKGKKIIITNAYRKHSQQMTKKDLEKVEFSKQAKTDYLKRVERGDYYEKA